MPNRDSGELWGQEVVSEVAATPEGVTGYGGACDDPNSPTRPRGLDLWLDSPAIVGLRSWIADRRAAERTPANDITQTDKN